MHKMLFLCTNGSVMDNRSIKEPRLGDGEVLGWIDRLVSGEKLPHRWHTL